MVICVGDHTFHVHKCLMIASCDYFDAMLRSGMQETRASSIELKGVSVSGFVAVVDFVYSGERFLRGGNEVGKEHVLPDTSGYFLLLVEALGPPGQTRSRPEFLNHHDGMHVKLASSSSPQLM